MYNTALELHNDLLGTYFDEYFALSDAKKSKINPEYAPATLILVENNYSDISFINKNQVMKTN